MAAKQEITVQDHFNQQQQTGHFSDILEPCLWQQNHAI